MERDAQQHDVVDASTRERVLRLVVEDGPVSVVELASRLALTAAGARRHVAALEAEGQITVHQGPDPLVRGRRGRPPRRYVATERGQAVLASAYSDLAVQALRYLASAGGGGSVEDFAARRAAELRERHGHVLRYRSVEDRVAALAESLSREGFAASARPVPGGRAVQLCQGHCPVQDVAALFPQLCEAETKVFSEMLGVHVQRLSTLAGGGHVCTTHVPTTTPAATDRPAPAHTVEGTR
ncbi:helix-turn-helix transcriptional regulator [Cellulomonas bogoriensis]|uniref:Transcriptional regulator n=1 Tax=Cellulomonas bogoriensis 69B4 = DSM 16987 TaxID=1386082 RepID=A0A0A0BZ47_9CELL|nr:winged helix-turn-helix transcriptional regulator [Cellulomonas bogoriensis]KGM13668.1 transcriptional regulator [Cellulomonas bogoriensis 69B4 = DSM 16987]